MLTRALWTAFLRKLGLQTEVLSRAGHPQVSGRVLADLVARRPPPDRQRATDDALPLPFR